MWKVVAKDDTGCVIWQASPFDTEEEANTYIDRAVERGDDKTQWGEEMTLWVERM